MSLLQQAVQLLSTAPGNLVYHLVTLFALQAVLGITWSQWQRNRSDHMALRMAVAAAVIFLARLGLLLIGLLTNDSGTAVSILPPLEQSGHTITAVFLVWGVLPASRRWPRLGDALALIAAILIGVMTLSFVPAWRAQGANGVAYTDTAQVTVWGITQLFLYGCGLLVLLARRRWRFSLHAAILTVALLTHAASFWQFPAVATPATHIAYWIRLGHLVIFPLWAALAYRQTLTPLLLAQQAERPLRSQVAQTLQLATPALDSLRLDDALPPAVQMLAQLSQATFAALALRDDEDPNQLRLISWRQNAAVRHWHLNLGDWPAVRQTLEQKRPVVLQPRGQGARQLYDWYAEMGMPSQGPLLIQPVMVQEEALGVVLLAGPPHRLTWSDEDKAFSAATAAFLARIVNNARQHAASSAKTAVAPVAEAEANSGKVIALESERDRLAAETGTLRRRLQQSESRAATASKQARDLAAALDEMEHINRDEQILALEAEIEALRESLIEAEEAMAMAAASETELSTEWVMHTITRYSGQLEEAQAQIQLLEEELTERDKGPFNEVVASLIQELRTPMTSIAGYTDILLAERIGILGAKQREFLQRVQSNTERMGTLLEQVVQLTTEKDKPAASPDKELVDVQEVVETAVGAVITQIREKRLRLALNVGEELPLLPMNREAMRQIMTSLLGNACQASPKNGRVAVSVHSHTMESNGSGPDDPFTFMQVAVTDSGGGIDVDDRARVFDPQHDADSPLIAGLGDTGAALSVARSLAETHGGRIWVDSVMGVGSTFSALFPVADMENGGNGETAVFLEEGSGE